MDEAVYGVWLQLAMGEGSRKVPLLLDYFGSCRTVYESDDVERRLSGLLLQPEMDRMANTPLDAAVEIMEACRRLQYSVLTPDSDKYPNRLRNIPDYPAALYISGELPDIDDEVCVGMVGTRRASRYGYNAATMLSKDLAACGAIIISGCARGIDTASHQGALIGGGKTIAVLGCGINTRYNMENEGLRKVISTSGALISEYPPGSPPLNYHFPTRNRIISALSLGVIVVEAGAKSGSLITANLALEQGKDIFSVPGEISNMQAKGTNRLIFDGAKPIESAYDVLEEYVTRYPHRLRLENLRNQNSRVYDKNVHPKWEREDSAQKIPKKSQSEPVSMPKAERKSDDVPVDKLQQQPSNECPAPVREEYPVGMSENAVKVLKVLDTAPKLLQELIDELSMSASSVMQSITELEIYGAVETLPGKRYKRR